MMTTHEDRPYIYPADLDMGRALAVYRIMHGEATPSCWKEIDGWVKEKGITRVLQDISRILDHNHLDSNKQAAELSWWLNQLSGQGIVVWNVSPSTLKN
jgi:hypothetical protein